MISYRFKRRAFIAGMSGGVGLKIMLRNMEAVAQGATRSPGRLLVQHWPVGIVAGSNDSLFAATSGSTGGSQGLQPFTDAGLAADMTVIKGISSPGGAGGSHEGGMPALMTGVGCPGTRSGQAETDDGYAGGPSFEQVMLSVAGTPLKVAGAALNYVNAGCDTRTDFGEVSTKCMSYGTGKQSVGIVPSGTGQENVPNMPNLSPLNLYNLVFQNFTSASTSAAGEELAAAPPPADQMLSNLASRRSVLDFAKTEIDILRQMAPGESRMKLDNHFEAIKQMEDSVSAAINNYTPGRCGGGTGGMGGNMGMGGMGGSATGRGGSGGMAGGAGGRGGSGGSAGGAGGRGGTGGAGGTTGVGGTGGMPGPGCKGAMVAPSNAIGITDPMRGAGNNYTDPTRGATEDATNLAIVGKAHMSVLKAAFVCDVVRVGTMLWAPGTNHVGFKGLFPNQANTVYQHHPQSHKIYTSDTVASSSVSSLNASAQFLFQVQLWFFRNLAENLKEWKTSYDGFGNSLLDYTVMPYLTEVRATSHERSSMPAMIIGGKQLGFAHNRYVTGNFTCNQFWGLIGPSLGHTSTQAPFAAPPSALANLWTRPPA
jgi:hypothetical protein